MFFIIQWKGGREQTVYESSITKVVDKYCKGKTSTPVRSIIPVEDTPLPTCPLCGGNHVSKVELFYKNGEVEIHKVSCHCSEYVWFRLGPVKMGGKIIGDPNNSKRGGIQAKNVRIVTDSHVGIVGDNTVVGSIKF